MFTLSTTSFGGIDVVLDRFTSVCNKKENKRMIVRQTVERLEERVTSQIVIVSNKTHEQNTLSDLDKTQLRFKNESQLCFVIKQPTHFLSPWLISDGGNLDLCLLFWLRMRDASTEFVPSFCFLWWEKERRMEGSFGWNSAVVWHSPNAVLVRSRGGSCRQQHSTYELVQEHQVRGTTTNCLQRSVCTTCRVNRAMPVWCRVRVQ